MGPFLGIYLQRIETRILQKLVFPDGIVYRTQVLKSSEVSTAMRTEEENMV